MNAHEATIKVDSPLTSVSFNLAKFWRFNVYNIPFALVSRDAVSTRKRFPREISYSRVATGSDYTKLWRSISQRGTLC